MGEKWIDISVPLRTAMVRWPGDSPARIERVADMTRGDDCNLSTLAMSAHTGTHMDAPLHFLREGAGIETMPLEAGIGPARVIAIRDARRIEVKELEPYRLGGGERVLFKTRNSERCWQGDEFVKNFVYIPAETARFLAERGVRTVGIDYLSVGAYEGDGEETHRILLGAGIWIIEGLDLSGVEPGDYELVCLPLKIAGADGAPARAAVRARRSREA